MCIFVDQLMFAEVGLKSTARSGGQNDVFYMGKQAMSPSLGWIQAFLCVADHLDYKLAAQDLGIHANSVGQRVQKLEQWLVKLLIMDDPIELTEPDGLLFIDIAWDVLQTVERACPSYKNDLTGTQRTRKAKQISNIRLDDFERFLSAADQGTYKGVASLSGCDVTTVQRSIKALEAVTGKQFFSGHSSIKLTGDGETFRKNAAHIVKLLNDFRAVVPADYDPVKADYEPYFRYLINLRSDFQADIFTISRTGKKQRGKVRLDDRQALLRLVNTRIESLNKAFGPFDPIPGKSTVINGADIDMSFYTDAKAKE